MSSGSSDLVDIDVEIKHMTDKAVLVSDGDNDVWLPLSQTEVEDNVDGTGVVTIPEWLAIEKGLL